MALLWCKGGTRVGSAWFIAWPYSCSMLCSVAVGWVSGSINITSLLTTLPILFVRAGDLQEVMSRQKAVKRQTRSPAWRETWNGGCCQPVH